MPLKVWSLPDLMKIFELRKLTNVLGDLVKLRDQCDLSSRTSSSTIGSPLASSDKTEEVLLTLQAAHDVANKIGWEAAREKIVLINIYWQHRRQNAALASLAADIRNTVDVLMAASWKQKIVHVEERLNDYINNEKLFGEQVAKAFPSAQSDLKEAGNCIAAQSGTAAVFHLMRAVEWALRSLCRHVGVIRIGKKRKPTSKTKYTPLNYATWEQMLGSVQANIDKRVERLRPGAKKQDLQQFYYPLLQDLGGFRDAWRNHTMHTRDEYSPAAAEDILRHVKRFMVQLSTKVSE
jgi:hypothetical protein